MQRLRSSEVLIISYFFYVAVVAQVMIDRPWRAWVLAAVAAAIFLFVSQSHRLRILRDWLPLLAILFAFQQMDWFRRATDHHLEKTWLDWDRWLLYRAHLSAIIESAGVAAPLYLELCYLLVYAVAPVTLWIVMTQGRRDDVNRFWLAYLAGTLGAYALFPYFPSQPPRVLFMGQDLPRVLTPIRFLNLALLTNYSIHSSVFPSAHVSSAFSAAWALRAIVPTKPKFGWAMMLYAISVAIATVYGRYHYAADVAAGFAISLLAVPLCSRTGRTMAEAL